ncbi:hypothetical protein F0A16_02720 [Salinicola corii]|uniref:Uncharacterized protein n=1 Tax=Salinicola corii TaxID=2606937 RepID=A0A640WJB0_9GAMM|nr:hypothetical protein [Salinicola corii]KAA0020719.1 hypothetical protein F0A16_02720 [Salinicola corii]
MTFYTGGAPALDSRTLLDLPSTTGDAFEAGFDDAFADNPGTSVVRIAELSAANNGFEWTSPSTWFDGQGPDRMPASEARQKVKGLGLEGISIPDQGITSDALDILVDRHRAELARNQMLARSESSMVPQVFGGLAATFVDPLNIAAAFIPIVGEARYASLVARQTSALGRAGARAGVGAIEGAAGAALLEPLPLFAANQDQTEYGLSDSLTNIAFGGILGGGLHSAGGAISDAVRRRAAEANPGNPVPDAPDIPGVDTPSVRVADGDLKFTPSGVTSMSLSDLAARAPSPQTFTRALDDDPIEAVRTTLAKQVQNDEAYLNRRAQRQAAEEIANQIDTGGRVEGVRALRTELADVETQLSGINDLRNRLQVENQQRGMSRSRARNAANIRARTAQRELSARRDELTSTIEGNRRAEMSTQDRVRLLRGEVPEQFREQIDQRATEIRDGLRQNPLGAGIRTARSRAEGAHWRTRADALRAAVVQSVTGQRIDAEAIYDLSDPTRSRAAMERIKNPQPRQADPQSVAESQRAQEVVTENFDDLEDSRAALAEEEQRFRESVARMSDEDRALIERSSPELQEADQLAQAAQRYSLAYREAVFCNLN